MPYQYGCYRCFNIGAFARCPGGCDEPKCARPLPFVQGCCCSPVGPCCNCRDGQWARPMSTVLPQR